MIVLSDKFVPKSELEKIWEGLRMLKIFQIAEEKGMEKGMEKGKLEIAQKMKLNGMASSLILELTGLNL
jgi:predicted transposase/invertase (TIGR01784 family)